MPPIHVRAIGLVAPGITDWATARSILLGESEYVEAPIPALPPALLPPNERRRATQPTRLALEAARQATHESDVDARTLTSVFASADGDMDLIDRLCKGIAQPEVALSPTLFHNSVHNAVAGYWSIGTDCKAPSTSIAAGDGSLAAGLIECATQLASDCREILLVAYDLPAPPLLDAHRHFHGPFACALLLALGRRRPHLATLDLALEDSPGRAGNSDLPEALEQMHQGNPAARILPVLSAIARRQPTTVQLRYLEELCLNIQVGGFDLDNA
jgi:hypothetical protein